MAKKAKKIQTDYTTGGHNISQTAIPLYQENLNMMADYNRNPDAERDRLLDKYYSANNAYNQDFLRNYNRAMSGTTANNYAATGGGYSSSGQRAYDDMQRYQNDLASRLYDVGLSGASSMAQQYYNNLLQANPQYQSAYSLGKDYSDIEQYNNAVKQANRNWLSNITGAVGGVMSAIPTPVTQGIGAGLGAVSQLTATDASDILGSPNQTPANYATAGMAIGNTGRDIYNWFKGNKGNTNSNNSGFNSNISSPWSSAFNSQLDPKTLRMLGS